MFQVSLRSLLVFVALCALAIVSFRFASPGWRTVVLTIVLVMFWTATIVAFVGRGPRQAFAIGCTLSMFMYGLALLSAGDFGNWSRNPELYPSTGRLPTSQLLNPLFNAIVEVRWIDFQTGKEIKDYDPTSPQNATGAATVTLSELPNRGLFGAIGHSWWSIVFGLCGGWFARFVYLRRIREREPLATGRS